MERPAASYAAGAMGDDPDLNRIRAEVRRRQLSQPSAGDASAGRRTAPQQRKTAALPSSTRPRGPSSPPSRSSSRPSLSDRLETVVGIMGIIVVAAISWFFYCGVVYLILGILLGADVESDVGHVILTVLYGLPIVGAMVVGVISLFDR